MKKNPYGILFLLVMMLTLSACSVQSQSYKGESESKQNEVNYETLTSSGEMELSYAKQYKVEELGSYKKITIGTEEPYLLVPEGETVPTHLPENMTVLQQPLNRTYLVSTSAMDLVQTVGAIGDIRLSGTKESNWYIQEAKDAMESGDMVYAGKYSAPDYELILKEGCNLAIENTMIYHNPEVKEKLEELQIPVLVERSSYESHPLGRLEWIKLYGLLFGREEEAEAYFEQQKNQVVPLMENADTGCTVAFFSVTSNGSITVRKPKDYISQMIDIAGGTYVLGDVQPEEENALSTMNMQMEDFYAAAKDADILIYNSTIEGELTSIADLVEKNKLFSDFEAVKTGKVYCTSNNFFQKSTGVGEFMNDLYCIFTEDGTDSFTYLKRLE